MVVDPGSSEMVRLDVELEVGPLGDGLEDTDGFMGDLGACGLRIRLISRLRYADKDRFSSLPMPSPGRTTILKLPAGSAVRLRISSSTRVSSSSRACLPFGRHDFG